MSYSIMYDRQVIKTPTGYTLVVLDGDNNVYDPGNKRRERHWSCVLLNKTEKEFDDYFISRTGDTSQEHFKANGKWVDDAALIRWYRNGLKNARTVEEFAEMVGSIHCYIIVRDGDHRTEELSEHVRTTEEFLDWVDQVKQRRESAPKSQHIYEVTSFGGWKPLRLPKSTANLQGKVYIKFKNRYVYEINERGWTTGSDPQQAIVFNSLQAARAAAGRRAPSCFSFHDVKQLERKLSELEKKTCVIVIDRGGWSKEYFAKKTRRQIRIACRPENAKHFTRAEAERYIQTIHPADKSIKLRIEEHSLTA